MLVSALLAITCLVQGSLLGSITNLFVDEIETMDQAITASEKRLAMQRKIKNYLLELRRLEENVMKMEDPKLQASHMVILAEQILREIQEEHMESLFSPAYIEELRFYSSFARKTHLQKNE